MASAWADLESTLKPTIDPRVFVEPRDRDTSAETVRQAAWVNSMRRDHKSVAVFAIPNGQRRTQWERNRAMREGLYIGFPDTGALWDGGKAFLEWKDGDGSPDDNQIDCLNRLVAMGIPCAIVRTSAAAISWLRSVGAPV